MHRPSLTLASFGVATVLSACGGTVAEPAASEADRSSTTPSAAEVTPTPADSTATVSPVLAWTFGDEVTTDAGEVQLDIFGGHELEGTAATFDGRTGFAATEVSAPITTTSSFSVSAWVSLTDPVEHAAAVSQLGEEAAAFYLGLGGTTWDFAMKDADTNEPGHTIRAQADPALVDIGKWVHLVGVHDAEDGAIRLHVNGVLAAAVAFDEPWQAAGELTIGRSQAHFSPADFWPGSVAGVAVYGGALTTEQVRAIYQATEPSAPPPAAESVAESFTGTWDFVMDEAGREVILADFAGLVDSAEEVVTRIGFDGNDWWQGYLFDGELFLLDGVPEGDGGSFFLVPGEPVIATIGAHGQARIAYEWAIDGDSLTLTAVEECSLAGPEWSCTQDQSEMDPVMLLVTDQTFTRSGDDPSY